MRRVVTIVLGGLFAFTLFLPLALTGQACQGSTAPRGSGVVVGTFSFTDRDSDRIEPDIGGTFEGPVFASALFPRGSRGFEPQIGGNFEGPMFGSGSVSYTNPYGADESQWIIGAQVGAEALTESDLSLCLGGSVGYSWITEFDIDGQIYAADASIGYPAGNGGKVFIVPNGSIGVVHSTVSADGIEDSNTAARFAGGLTVGSRSIFVGVDVSYATFENSDAVFGIGVGAVF